MGRKRILRGKGESKSHAHLSEIKQIREAVTEGRVFTIFGSYPDIRGGLIRRGWAEKKPPVYDCDDERVKHSASGRAGMKPRKPKVEAAFLSATRASSFDRRTGLVTATPSLIWSPLISDFDLTTIQPQQLINHFEKVRALSTKIGLAESVRDLIWTASIDPITIHPKSYIMSNAVDCADFIENYCENAAWALLVNAKRWRISSEILELALKAANIFLAKKRHEDIDRSVETTDSLSTEEWQQIVDYHMLCCESTSIEPEPENDSSRQLADERLQNVITELKQYIPQFEMSGTRNIWIIKPAASSRGRGITCNNRLSDILRSAGMIAKTEYTTWNPVRDKASLHKEFIVQKYIENPYLVRNTKFDIRQWVLVTSWNPLVLYFYGKCYLRFSSRPFRMDGSSFGDGEDAKAIHLCNNSIQAHLESFDEALPWAEGCMWSSETFAYWLKTNYEVPSSQSSENENESDPWATTVYPQMQKIVKCIFEAVQDRPDDRKNSFELFGIDFMLDEALNVWLIEVNTSPDISHSTPVTASLVPEMLEDLLKVVVDKEPRQLGKWVLLSTMPETKELPHAPTISQSSAPQKRSNSFIPRIADLKVIGKHLVDATESCQYVEQQYSSKDASETKGAYQHSKPQPPRQLQHSHQQQYQEYKSCTITPQRHQQISQKEKTTDTTHFLLPAVARPVLPAPSSEVSRWSLSLQSSVLGDRTSILAIGSPWSSKKGFKASTHPAGNRIKSVVAYRFDDTVLLTSPRQTLNTQRTRQQRLLETPFLALCSHRGNVDGSGLATLSGMAARKHT